MSLFLFTLARPGIAMSAEGLGDYFSTTRWTEWPAAASAGSSDPLDLSVNWDYLADSRKLSILSCTSRLPGVITWLYFAPDGTAYCLRRAARISTASRLYLTSELEADPAGAFVVLLSDAPLEAEVLKGWMEHVNTTTRSPSLLSRRVFGTAQTRVGRIAWEDSIRQRPQLPAALTRYSRSGFPRCLARLDSSGQPVLKDCSVASTAWPEFIIDNYGPLSVWELDWGGEISLHFGIEPDGLPDQAELVIYTAFDRLAPGDPNQPAGAGSESLDIEVNGWDAGGLAPVSDWQEILDGPQPLMLPLSQYLREGRNSIRISVARPSARVWQIQRLEVWSD
jgi:hypothetical protein